MVLQLIEQHNLIDIWRIRNPILKRYNFRKNHFSGLIQRRLDYIFVSNNIQENIKDINILPSFCSDHSPLFVNYQTSNDFRLGKHFWKFNSSLTKDEDHIFKEKPQAQWEFLKYEIRKFSIAFSKKKSEEKRENLARLEGKLRVRAEFKL